MYTCIVDYMFMYICVRLLFVQQVLITCVLILMQTLNWRGVRYYFCRTHICCSHITVEANQARACVFGFVRDPARLVSVIGGDSWCVDWP